MNARLTLPLVALLLLAAVQIPPAPATAQATAGCEGYANTIQTATYTVPVGASVSFAQSTAIIATRVVVLGHLATSDALPGQDAPGLCIQAEALEVLGTITTGNGHAGFNDYNATQATGGAGTSGGDLTLNLVNDLRTLNLPMLTIGPGAILATGNGGTGGTALAGTPCGLVPGATTFIELTSGCPGLPCSALTTSLLPPSRRDPCDTSPTLPGGVACEELLHLVPGFWRVDPCEPVTHGCDVLVALFALTTPECLPDPAMVSCWQLFFLKTSFGVEEMVCQPSPPCTDFLDSIPPTAAGGPGGDAGALSLWAATTSTLAGLPGSALLIGRGGDGGHALTAASQGGTATGGDGGASLVYVQGATMPDPAAVEWFTAHPPASSAGGNGGSASATANVAIDVCKTIQYCINAILGGDAECGPDVTCDNSSNNTFRLVRCFMGGVVECGGPAIPPWGLPLVGCPGDPATEFSGPAGNGTGGASGSRGDNGFDYGASFGKEGGSGSVSCGGTPKHGERGGDGKKGGDGGSSSAYGGAGKPGILAGGKGGDASLRASLGGNGGQGGKGGNGASPPVPFCGFAHPGGGGDGGDGGASGSGTSSGGGGGGAVFFGGDGGNAEGTPGKPGEGGVGGSTGAPATFCWDKCVTDPVIGEWGCGGLAGAVGQVKLVGGAGGTAPGGITGQDGNPNPPGFDVPASQPPGRHNAHGAGAARDCPFP